VQTSRLRKFTWPLRQLRNLLKLHRLNFFTLVHNRLFLLFILQLRRLTERVIEELCEAVPTRYRRLCLLLLLLSALNRPTRNNARDTCSHTFTHHYTDRPQSHSNINVHLTTIFLVLTALVLSLHSHHLFNLVLIRILVLLDHLLLDH